MNKHHTIALYVLVASNLIGLVWIRSDIKSTDYQDRTKYVSVTESNVGIFDDSPYLNMKLRNDSDGRISRPSILVTVSDTNGTFICTLEKNTFFTMEPHSERPVSVQLSFGKIKDLDRYVFKPWIGHAESD